MKLNKNQTAILARNIVERLLSGKMISPLLPKEKLVSNIEEALNQDGMIEDKLNAEVREIMKNYSDQIEKGEADYNRLFQMIKQKLAKERGIEL
jgi:hypothetical protein